MHYFKLMGPKFWLTNFRHHAIRKEHIHGALKLHCSSYISKIVWWLPMFDFGIFCHLLRLMGIYRAGAPSGCLKKKSLLYLFLSAFLKKKFCSSLSFFLSSFFCLSLSLSLSLSLPLSLSLSLSLSLTLSLSLSLSLLLSLPLSGPL